MIEMYEFGKIVINGNEYHKDLIVYPDTIESGWWRQQGHSLSVEDIKRVFASHPDVIVIGTGYHGVMDVPSQCRDAITSQGIDLIVEKTTDACHTYNRLAKTHKVVGAFHLTC
jgi:hypothetical protein